MKNATIVVLVVLGTVGLVMLAALYSYSQSVQKTGGWRGGSR